MGRYVNGMSKKRGLPPGSIVFVGQKSKSTRITVVDYDEKNVEEKKVSAIEEVFEYRDRNTVTWINIDGLGDMKIVKRLGEHFGVHSLVSEDIANTAHRPKMEDHRDHIFIILKMLYLDPKRGHVLSEQVSMIVGKNYVLSFQESEGDVFDFVRDRIRQGKGKIRKMKGDYLAYSLMDAIVDNYFVVMEKLGEDIESLEDRLMKRVEASMTKEIHRLKRDMIFLRKQVWPLREVVSGLQRGESRLITRELNLYLKDLYDHTIQVMDTVESFRDMLSGLQDIFLTSISNRMNEVMKVLTIFASIFIPLTFIAGIYGMNFEYMPELKMRSGYFIVLGVMLALALGMLSYFKKKNWI